MGRKIMSGVKNDRKINIRWWGHKVYLQFNKMVKELDFESEDKASHSVTPFVA